VRAFDFARPGSQPLFVLLDTGIQVQALPLWRDALAHPEQFINPALIDNIRREGIRFPAPPNDLGNTVR